MATIAEIKTLVRRRKGIGVSQGDDGKRLNFSRNSTQIIESSDNDGPMTDKVIRANTNLATPDDTRGLAVVGEVNGQRLQDYANTHLSEGEAPGRIPRFWNDRRSGKVGRSISGNEAGDNSLTLDVTGDSNGGMGDALFIPHLVVPRGSMTARAHLRTIDDSAGVPAVYVSDPTRR